MPNKPLVIFGSGDLAQLAQYYFTTDSEYDVVAFTVDQDFLQADTQFGLPMVAFETLETAYPPDEFDVFIALSYSKLNEVRKNRYQTARSKGYTLASYISSHATILNDGHIGDNCFILEDNTVQPFVEIGNNVTLWSGNHIGHHSKVEDHTFIASHVVISGGVVIEAQCFIGVNATLRDHITVGEKSVIGAGTLVLKSVTAESLLIGSGTKASDRKSTDLKRI